MAVLGGAVGGVDQFVFVFVVVDGLISGAGTKIASEASWSFE